MWPERAGIVLRRSFWAGTAGPEGGAAVRVTQPRPEPDPPAVEVDSAVDWPGLARAYGSPLYVYRLAELRANHRLLTAALPTGSLLLYSVKANPHPRLMRELHRLGCGAEVSSLGELAVARSAEVPADDIVYTGPGKTPTEVAAAVRAGARLFSVDSPAQLAIVRAAAARSGVQLRAILRVNPAWSVGAQGLRMTGVPSQFGVDAEYLLAHPERLGSTAECEVVGLHIYLGSNVPSATALAEQFTRSVRLAAELCAALGIVPRFLDLGGGFGRPFARPDVPPDLDGLDAVIESALTETFPGWRGGEPRIAFESGRYLVASAGTLLATVADVKRSRDREFVVLDSGVNHLGGMSALGRLPPMRATFLPVGRPPDRPDPAARIDVVGPLCTPLDSLGRGGDGRPAIGDRVLVPNVGAYGLTASLLAFLSHACPAELVLDGAEVIDASRLVLERRPVAPGTGRG